MQEYIITVAFLPSFWITYWAPRSTNHIIQLLTGQVHKLILDWWPRKPNCRSHLVPIPSSVFPQLRAQTINIALALVRTQNQCMTSFPSSSSFNHQLLLVLIPVTNPWIHPQVFNSQSLPSLNYCHLWRGGHNSEVNDLVTSALIPL